MPSVVAERDDVEIDQRETEELAYLIARDDWLNAHAPNLVHREPSHECRLLVPGTAYGDEVHFDELDERGLVCGARWLSRGRCAFGAASEVISAVVGAEVEADWVGAAVRALEGERAWARRSRRPDIEVWKGNGELVHITAAVNRASIQRWGLDWSRMAAARGIAGSPRPELPVIFLDTVDSVGFFRRMAREPVDLWAVDVTDLWVENGPDGWYIHCSPIGPGRLRLLEGDGLGPA
jgi:hypothetical protein